MKIYDLVKDILEEKPDCRDSDKRLIWTVWNRKGLTSNGFITWEQFAKATSSESITRARRKVQELHPHLEARAGITRERRRKQKSKGTFVFREEVEQLPFDN